MGQKSTLDGYLKLSIVARVIAEIKFRQITAQLLFSDVAVYTIDVKPEPKKKPSPNRRK